MNTMHTYSKSVFQINNVFFGSVSPSFNKSFSSVNRNEICNTLINGLINHIYGDR